MSLPRYSEYKASGVEWLGDVPGHWKVKRLKQACHVFPSNVDKKSYDDETPVNLCNYTDVYYNETITADMEFMAATASDDQIAKFTLRAGDTIITKDSETADDIAIGAYVPADLPGVICGYHLSMIRPMTDTNGAFVKRLFDSTYVRSCVAVRSNGLTRVGLGQYEIDNLELPFPPPAEQRTIVAFLDCETGKIDALIAEQQQLVELLAEKRQAVISHAVTKGLNPNAKMKDSGIEWLGEVPEHWEVKRLKRVTSIIIDGAHFTPTYVDEGIPFLRVTDIQSEFIDMDRLKRIPLLEHIELIKRCNPRKGDILLSKNGTIGLTKIVNWDFEFSIFVSLCLIRPTTAISTIYLERILSSNFALEQFTDSSKQTSVSNLHLEKIREIIITLPGIDEQSDIATFLGVETAKLDTLTAEANRAIELLQERRSALISAAVTGKIDVRTFTSSSQAGERQVLEAV
jgi:type I restriction enzyme S subunit